MNNYLFISMSLVSVVTFSLQAEIVRYDDGGQISRISRINGNQIVDYVYDGVFFISSRSVDVPQTSETLVLKEPPDWSFQAGDSLSWSLLLAGDSPGSIRWYHNDVQVTALNDSLVLAIQDLTTEDAGTYYAIIENEFGQARTRTARLSVIGIPIRVELVAEPVSGGAIFGGGEVFAGEVVEVRAVNNRGYRFNRWSGGDVNDSTAPTTLIAPTQNTLFFAHFDDLGPPPEINVGTSFYSDQIRFDFLLPPSVGFCLEHSNDLLLWSEVSSYSMIIFGDGHHYFSVRPDEHSQIDFYRLVFWNE